MMEQKIYLKIKMIAPNRNPYWLWIYKNDGKFIMDFADDKNISIARKILNEEQVKFYIDTFGNLGRDIILERFKQSMDKTEEWKLKHKWYPGEYGKWLDGKKKGVSSAKT